MGVKQDIDKLRNLLHKHNVLYHEKDAPEISDAQYDALKRQLLELETQHPEFQDLFSPTQTVGAAPSSRFKKIKHSHPMLSLSNAFDENDVEDFLKKIRNFLGLESAAEIEFICEPKIDGLSFAAVYQDGKLVSAATRGDGVAGEDIINNIVHVEGIPQTIAHQGSLEIRGEVYMDKDDFELLNQNREKNGEDLFANPRNAAAGSLRQLDPNVTKQRKLKYFIWGGFFNGAKTQFGKIDFLKQLGFCANPLISLANSVVDMLAFYERIAQMRASLRYDIDGIVYKVNSIELQSRLGELSNAPRWAIAHKFPSEQAVTQILDIIVQVGRTGALTPVAVLQPVNVGGAMVARATLHNEEEIERKDFRVGDKVVIQRAGDVIPQLVEVLDKDRRSAESKPFKMPDTCPVCGGAVVKDQDQAIRRCTQSMACSAQAIEMLRHFVSRDAFNIEGLGERQIEDFFARGWLKNFHDIFMLKENLINAGIKLENIPGWGVKSVENLWIAIDVAKNVPFEKFIYALGIRHIGEGTSKLIAKEFKSLDNLLNSTQGSELEVVLTSIDGVGPIAAKAFMEYLLAPQNIDVIRKLGSTLSIEDFEDNAINSPIAGKSVVFTGALAKITRSEAKATAERLGAKVVSAVSKSTDYVIVGEDAGSKLKKAVELGVKTLSEDEWLNLLSS